MKMERFEKNLLSDQEIADFRTTLIERVQNIVTAPSFIKDEEWKMNLPETLQGGGKIPLGAMQDLFWGVASDKRYLTNEKIINQLEDLFLEK